jgi:hypothetical protein
LVLRAAEGYFGDPRHASSRFFRLTAARNGRIPVVPQPRIEGRGADRDARATLPSRNHRSTINKRPDQDGRLLHGLAQFLNAFGNCGHVLPGGDSGKSHDVFRVWRRVTISFSRITFQRGAPSKGLGKFADAGATLAQTFKIIANAVRRP